MARKSPRVPGYRPHTSGQARVTLDGEDYLLGKYGSPESHEEYKRLMAEWLEGKGRFAPSKPEEEAPPLSINELILPYYKWAETYYGLDTDHRRGDRYCIRDALRVVKELYGSTPAKDFGPKRLKACRQVMIGKDWSRTYVNAQVDRVRRMFRWGAEEELVPGSVYQDLRSVAGLRAGKSEARETKRVKPVALERVEAVLPHVPPPVQAMVRLQLLAGCRPAEVCAIRPIDLDVSNQKCWVYRPGSDQGEHGKHKTAHHGHDRLIFLGPRAQEVLRSYLGTKLDAYCFSPALAEQKRSEARRAARKSPMTPSQRKRTKKARRQRAPGEGYNVSSYRQAIYRACDRAFPLPKHLAPQLEDNGKREKRAAWWARLTAEEKAAVRAWRKQHRWHPNQLRHNRATELRRYGLDLAKTVLGHTKVETTQIYAEKDVQAAMELVAQIG